MVEANLQVVSGGDMNPLPFSNEANDVGTGRVGRGKGWNMLRGDKEFRTGEWGAVGVPERFRLQLSANKQRKQIRLGGAGQGRSGRPRKKQSTAIQEAKEIGTPPRWMRPQIEVERQYTSRLVRSNVSVNLLFRMQDERHGLHRLQLGKVDEGDEHL